MYRIINSLATAEYNRQISAVEVNFSGYGDPDLYHDTMDIAMNIALIYRTNRWLFFKDCFHDIGVENFLFFVRKWSNKFNVLFDPDADTPCQVGLVTADETYHHLLAQHKWLENPQEKFSNLQIALFTHREEAYGYLSSQPQEKITSA